MRKNLSATYKDAREAQVIARLLQRFTTQIWKTLAIINQSMN